MPIFTRMAQFSLYVHKGGIKPHSFHFIYIKRTIFRHLKLEIALTIPASNDEN